MKIHPMGKTPDRGFRKAMVNIGILGLLLSASACGQKGQLYPPPAPAKIEPPQAEALEKELPDDTSMKETNR